MCGGTKPDFFKDLARNIRCERESRRLEQKEREGEFLALQMRLKRLQMWKGLECYNEIIRLRKSKTF